MKALFYDVEKCELEEREVREHDFEGYCDIIGCDELDVVSRQFGGKRYAVVIDDDGLLKPQPKLSATSTNMLFSLAGNLIIFAYQKNNLDFRGLKKSDIKHIREHLKDFNGRKILMDCNL